MFTLQQIQEIARRLASMGKKDSDFKLLDTWKSLNGQDYIALVKDGANRAVSIDQLYTYMRENINGNIGDALDRITALETTVQELNTTLNKFIGTTNTHLTSLDNSIKSINEVLGKLTTKYTITVTPVTPNATVLINGVRQNSLEVTSGSTVNVKVSAEGYDTYEEFVLVEGDITLTPSLEHSQVTFTIAASPSDSVVRLNGVVRRSITVPTGTSVNWAVSRAGYITKSGSEVVEASYTLPVTLETIEGDKVNFTINVISPSNATVTIDDTQVNTVVVDKGSEVTWSVEAPHYTSQSGRETVNEDTVKNITLVAEQVTLTINPTPADANVELNSVSQKSITVDYNTRVHIKVSKEGYITHEEDYTVTKTETKDVTLTELVEVSWTNLFLSQADYSENPVNAVPLTGGRVAFKATVTAHFNDSSTEKKDVSSQATWSKISGGNYCVPLGGGIYNWHENTSGSERACMITATVTGPDLVELSGVAFSQQKGPELTINPETLEFSSEQSTQEVTIESNTSWNIN